MTLEKEFIENLPNNKYKAGVAICDALIAFDIGLELREKFHAYDEYIDYLAILDAFIEANDLPFEVPSIGNEKHQTISSIMSFCNSIRANLEKTLTNDNFSTSRDKYLAIFGASFIYKFTDGDLNKIQALINELRNLIVQSELFDAKHKERLLSRLETLQNELHKKVSSLDKFWGLVGEAGVVLGKFGSDAKPFVDIIKQITRIIWSTQITAEELPSGTRMLALKSDDIETT